MKKIGLLVVTNVLAACSLWNEDISKYSSNSGSNRDPYDPSVEVPYKNIAHESNKKVTNMVSTTYDQLNRFIAHRMGGYSAFPINDYQEIAKLAVWLTSEERTAKEIEDKFYENAVLLHNAMYVVNKKLAGCVNFTASSSGADAGACFVKWREENADKFDKAAQDIRDNADLITLQEASFSTNNDTILRFLLNDASPNGADGEITKIEVNGTKYTRIDDSNSFQNGDAILTYNSLGKELGLSYSDFGSYYILNKKTDKILTNNTPFAGGYEAREVTNISQDIKFTGRAVGVVTNNKNSSERIDISGTATLNFDQKSGVSTLGANFSNWYDIVVQNDSAGTIKFNNYKNNANNYDMQVSGSPVEGTITANGADLNVKYYGQVPTTGIPTEASGLVQYNDPNSIKLDMAFGAK